ncbi:ubiquinol-cytochrome c reductase iron-sulfur subunit [Acidimicrobiia bacterium]|jgi:cytochrome b6-f complex iron-sulfur subunit|nr:ubiquinol-cytochrome c reductase iron-sulfur subunit [Acidimicrobiia bacterium]MDA7572362.1 ubiquinol-cytochrome c reductase iron-sulfur subunit [bacterium]MDA8652873.1 ubiquinol-cytochrome c reductase iron-sulfur subunit [Candidatus Actinomarina sp.]MDA7547886.1 ubiquinol-cytochrome c reductase iron-sulfur subunit [Acidimicrobiia bacterium]MDA7595027.1 ubiquinol-cytochrome c reductase iron-sulfur subunit [Acidimicrobiia bacterium]|tara:strand:- start:2013 stop:2906 length:894 start_codon:yes stop_codon:yes gene_type:complete
MSIVELSFIAIGAIGLLGVVGIVAIVSGRGPGNIDWKKNLDKRAVKAEKSKEKTSFFAPSKPKSIEEVNVEEVTADETEEVVEETDGSIKIEEKVVYEEISEEERYITRKQFLGKALGGTFGAFMGIQALAWLGFLWPKVSGGFGSKVDAGKIEDLKNQIIQADGSVIPAFIPEARAYVLPFSESTAGDSQFTDGSTIADGLVAVYQRCVHLGCRVPWCNSSQGFECPCHGSKYNMVGEYYAGPAPRNLDRFVVNVSSAGKLIIDTGTIIESPRAPGLSVKYPQGLSCIALAPTEES